jgi:nicotinate-nucleotide adenylyltransferase
MKIGLYGGAFNPIHFGHLKVIEHALDVGKLDQLRVVPAWKHSFGKDMAPYEDRLWMVHLAVPYVHDRRVVTSDAERTWDINYTVDLVERLRETEPNDQNQVPNEWVLIIGPDIMENAHKWHRWDDLTKMVEILVVPEQGPERSTLIREAARAGERDKVRGFVPVPILHYIMGKGLYT